MREHILKVAERLFYSEGIRAIGIDRVIAEANVAKATLYRYFPAKDLLVEEYLRARHVRVIDALRSNLGPQIGQPRDRLLMLFDVLEAKACTDGFRGCAFLIAVAENEASAGILAIAREHKAAVRTFILEITSLLPVDADPLATDIALCYEGALATMSINRSPEAARIAKRCVSVLIDAAITSYGRLGAANPGASGPDQTGDIR